MGILFRNGGLLTTIQDTGRIGYQRFGVSASGVMDTRSSAYANLLVGNETGEAVLEVTLMGPQMEFTADTIIAVTGADLSPQLNGGPFLMYRAVPVHKGDVLSFGAIKTGCRAYIAFAGGLDIPPAMGSRSTYMKAKLGGLEGRKLNKGDVISFRKPANSLKNLGRRGIAAEDFGQKEKVVRVILGPQEDAFTPKGIETFLHGAYTVTNEFDRMGYRLDGEVVEHRKDGNIISDGIAFGAIQIPSEGKPIIMMSDRQTTGGYTKIATVISADLPLIAQSKAGDVIRFRKIDVETAQELYMAQLVSFQKLAAQFEADRPAAPPAAPKAVPVFSFAPVAANSTALLYRVKVGGNIYEVKVEPIH